MPILRVQVTSNDAKVPPQGALRGFGPTVHVSVGPAVETKDLSISRPTDRQVMALVDTGASDCCIHESLATELGLKIIDRCDIGGVAGKNEHNIYMARIVIPVLNIINNGRLIGYDLDAEQKVILGRDILAHVIMTYDGLTGTVVFAL